MKYQHRVTTLTMCVPLIIGALHASLAIPGSVIDLARAFPAPPS
jgi:hypothetical protein